MSDPNDELAGVSPLEEQLIGRVMQLTNADPARARFILALERGEVTGDLIGLPESIVTPPVETTVSFHGAPGLDIVAVTGATAFVGYPDAELILAR
jgi:hypothetical protein